MLKYLLCGAAALSLISHAGGAHASGVYINGVQQHGNTINVPYGHGTHCCPTAPAAVTYEAAPVTYEAAPVAYETAPVTYESAPVTEGELIYIDEPAVAAPVVYEQPAVVTEPIQYVQPAAATAPVAYVEPAAARGWSSRVYVGARGGWSAPRDTDFNLLGGGVANEYDNAGYNIAAVVGWGGKVQNSIGYRLEAELGYQMADIDSHAVGGNTFSGSQAFGDTKTLYGFANAYLDIPLVQRLNGVVGGGVGLGKVEFDSHGVGPVGVVMDDSDTVFGYHVDAGLSYDVTDRLALEAMYRYTSFVDVELTARDGATSETDVDTHNVLVGARYGF